MSQKISFDAAQLCKEKGFNNPTLYYYDFMGDLGASSSDKQNWNISKENIYSVPTLSELHKWLRDNHNLYVSVISKFPTKHYPKVHNVDKSGSHRLEIPVFCDFNLYEDAFERGLYESLELI